MRVLAIAGLLFLPSCTTNVTNVIVLPDGGGGVDSTVAADGAEVDSATVEVDSNAPDAADAATSDTPDALDTATSDAPDASDAGDGGCVPAIEAAPAVTRNVFALYDKSSSMGPEVTSTKWAGARAGFSAFINDTGSSGLRVGLRFFPRPIDGTPVCDSAGYATPVAGYGTLPGIATALLAAIDAEKPDGFNSPFYPALGGGIRSVIAELAARPGELGAVVMITDGEPQGPAATCSGVNPEDPTVIANLAAAGFNTQGIRTHMIGLPGVNSTIANQIAAAGGTGAAVLATDPTKIPGDLQAALNVVRTRIRTCDVPLSAAAKAASSMVNVRLSGSSGTSALTMNADCAGSGDGWRYDSSSSPTAVRLCPKTCASLGADATVKAELVLGCPTRIAM